MTRPENTPALEAEQSESGAVRRSGPDPEKVHHRPPCKHCGGTLKWRSDAQCVECKRRRYRDRYATDPEFAERRRKQTSERKRERERIRTERGLCAKCGQPKLSEWYCWDCLNEKNDRKLRRSIDGIGI